MKDIKYRYVFRSKFDGGWGKQLKIDIYTIEQIERGEVELIRNDNWELLARDKYTGLHDKNNKEIYAGDILLERNGTYLGNFQVCFGRFWHVTGDSREGVDDEGRDAIGFYLKDYYGKNTFPKNKGEALWISKEPNIIEYFEVNGNKHKNPELVGESNEE